MNSGDIILIDFPFTVPTQSKVRPAVVIASTDDKYCDLVVCAISSILPAKLSGREISLKKSVPAFNKTGLRVDSVIKIDRIATLRQSDVISQIGECTPELWRQIVEKFKGLTEK